MRTGKKICRGGLWMNTHSTGHRPSSFQIILFGFISVILIGGGLLMLPVSSADGMACPLPDAMFTAVSAVCVTGLVVRDTCLAWSPFGQAVILLLIQIGGMGIALVASAVFLVSGRRIGLAQRNTMQDALSAPRVGGIVRFARTIIIVLLASELAGAALLSPVFIRDMGPARGIWAAVFHAVSALCNAGFDLMGEHGAFVSLAPYGADILVNLVIMGLIIWGGLGFLTWTDIGANRLRFRRYSLQSKMIFSMTAVLLLVPAIYFFFGEYAAEPLAQRTLHALFGAVTPRTAGFATADPAGLSDTGRLLTILLMLTGGAPGSTAGGMKVTTVGVLLVSAVMVFLRKKDINLFGRRIGEGTVRTAAALLVSYLLLFLLAGMFISSTENLPILTCLFETASAIGTVGLTLGITPGLSLASKIILMMLMFFGRVGGLTLIFAVIPAMPGGSARLVEEKITVG